MSTGKKTLSDRTTLGYLGEEFQFKLIKCFFEDQKFFINIQDIVNQNMFTTDSFRTIVGFMKDRYQFNETVTNYFEMETLLRSKITDAIRLEMCLGVINEIKNMDLQGMDLVEDESEKFFKQQNLTRVINEVQDIIKRGDFSNYYTIEDKIKKALETNTKQEYGRHLFENIEETLSETFRVTIPTGADKLDDALYGGLGKGELGVIIAPSGVGKTSATTGFGANAATYKCEQNNYKGFKVLHYFFEDKDSSIDRKYYGWLTGYDACDLHLPDVRPLVIKKLKEDGELQRMLKENVVIERLHDGEVSASDIKVKIRQQIARGFKPDLLILDYFECLKYERGDYNESEWSKEAITMRKIESIANEFDIAIWVPVQGSRETLGAEIVGIAQGGGSVKKVQIAHTIITFAQTEQMKVDGKLNIFLGKFRAGKMVKNKFLNVGFNNGTCRFDMENIDSEDVPFSVSSASTDIARRTLMEQNQRRK